MNYRRLGKTGLSVSEVSLGTWQVGGGWGKAFNDEQAERIIETAIDHGVNFIDTADVYSEGMSEAAVGRVVRRRSTNVAVATKCGRQLDPHVSESYTPTVLRQFVEDSLRNTGLDRLDLIQLHCPPTDVYYRSEIFELFDKLKQEGKIASLGVSVERVEEALKAIEFENVATVQIIFNMFRHRPADRFFQEAMARDVGIIVRVPLASGLLSGKFSKDTTFEPGDHRTFNRDGSAFDVGETFSGVPFEYALDVVSDLKRILGSEPPMAQQALRWILDFPQVGTIIPGASKTEHVLSNIASSGLSPLSTQVHAAIKELYQDRLRSLVHHRW